MLISEVKCRNCKHISRCHDPFLDLSLEITNSNIQGCLSSFFSSEYIDDDYECENCKKLIRPHKKFYIYKLPKYLAIHFKRFDFSGYRATKISKHISYPLNDLNLEE